MRDHLSYATSFCGLRRVVTLEGKLEGNFCHYFFSGYLSSVGSEGIAFLRSENQPKDVKFPFIQLQLFPSLLGNSKETMDLWHNYTNIKQEVRL